MRLLLDTQCWLWMQAAPERLSPTASSALENPQNELYLSSASSWEIAIKYRLGKLPLPVPPEEYVPSRLAGTDIKPLPVVHSHALAAASLPLVHRDPFDRILLAQAREESLVLATADRVFDRYEAEILWID